MKPTKQVVKISVEHGTSNFAARVDLKCGHYTRFCSSKSDLIPRIGSKVVCYRCPDKQDAPVFTGTMPLDWADQRDAADAFRKVLFVAGADAAKHLVFSYGAQKLEHLDDSNIKYFVRACDRFVQAHKYAAEKSKPPTESDAAAALTDLHDAAGSYSCEQALQQLGVKEFIQLHRSKYATLISWCQRVARGKRSGGA